jgi:ParB-like nuclease family protein
LPSLLDKIERVPIGSVKLYPGNARRGDLKAIAASLQENQQVSPLVVQRSTGFVLGGNHTLQAAQQLGWEDIDVVYVDADDVRARKINLALNRTADLGEYDDKLLLEQLADLDDLDGTGYAGDDLDELSRITGALGAEATAFLDEFTSPPPAPATPMPGSWPAAAPPSPGAGGDEDGGAPPPSAAPPGPFPTGPFPDPGPAPAPPPPAQEYVQLAWTVTPANREVIRRAITLAQQKGSYATAAEGLLAMSAHYLETFQPQGS